MGKTLRYENHTHQSLGTNCLILECDKRAKSQMGSRLGFSQTYTTIHRASSLRPRIRQLVEIGLRSRRISFRQHSQRQQIKTAQPRPSSATAHGPPSPPFSTIPLHKPPSSIPFLPHPVLTPQELRFGNKLLGFRMELIRLLPKGLPPRRIKRLRRPENRR